MHVCTRATFMFVLMAHSMLHIISDWGIHLSNSMMLKSWYVVQTPLMMQYLPVWSGVALQYLTYGSLGVNIEVSLHF